MDGDQIDPARTKATIQRSLDKAKDRRIDMTDIVEKLRQSGCPPNTGCMSIKTCVCDVMGDAVAEIERLRLAVMELCVKNGRMEDENKELRGIIQQAADDVVAASYPRAMHLEWLEAARKALAEDD